jgi:predicted nucleotidyltransferase
MDKDKALTILRQHADALRNRGIRHAALFGSVARGDAGPDSDIDILIELAPEAELDLFAYAGLTRFIAGLFNSPVDVVDVDALKPYERRPAVADAIYAF